MKKLWVDDIRNAPDDTWSVSRTVTSAIRAIARMDFEVISLDHDISHYENLDEADIEQEVRACKETFAAVAYYVAARFVGKPYAPRIVLHTSNTVAGDEMYAILGEHGIFAEKRYIGS